MEANELLEQAKAMIRAEGEVIIDIADQLGESFVQTVRLVSDCTGCIIDLPLWCRHSNEPYDIGIEQYY